MKKTVIILIILFLVLIFLTFLAVAVILPDLLPGIYRMKPVETQTNIIESEKDPAENEEADEDIILDRDLSSVWLENPALISGQARGSWYFEASFPVVLLDGRGDVMFETYAEAQADWMTADFVPFKVRLKFETPDTETGTIIFKKDNPSGLEEYDKSHEVDVRFKATTAMAGEDCQEDADCSLPPDFAVRSICPYEARCLDSRCTVICPDF